MYNQLTMSSIINVEIRIIKLYWQFVKKIKKPLTE
jgi:hypothetical protein